MKKTAKQSYVGIILTLITLIACGNVTGENKPVTIKLDYQKILKEHHKDYFVNIDNTDDITVSIQIIDTVKEGLDKYNFPERNGLLKLLEKGKLYEMQNILIELADKKLEDKRLASQLWFLNAQIYELDFLYNTTEDMEEKKVNAYKKLKELFPENPDYNEYIGGMFYINGDYDSAIEHTSNAINYILQNRKDNPLVNKQLIRLYIALGSYHEKQEDYSKALSYIKNSFELITDLQSNSNELLSRANIINARIYYKLKNFTSALEYAKRAESILENKNDSYWITITYNLLALIMTEIEPEEAEDYYIKAINSAIYYHGAYNKNIFSNYNNYAIFCKNFGMYNKAIYYYEKGIEIINKNQGTLKHRLAEQYNNIALTYDKMGLPEKAIDYYDRAIDFQTKNDKLLTESTINFITNMALSLHKLEEYNKALEYNKRALEIALIIYSTDHHKVAFVYDRLGNSYESIDETKVAIDYYDKAISIYQKNNMESSIEIANVYFNKAQSLFYLEDYNKAHNYLFLSYNIYNKIYGPDHPDTWRAKDGLKKIEDFL